MICQLAPRNGIREFFACGIQNLGNFSFWNLKLWALQSGIQLKDSGIPLTIRILNQSSTEWNPESKTVLYNGVMSLDDLFCLNYNFKILLISDVFFRDIYYSDVVFFGSQSIVDEIIDNLACMLKVPRHCLHVVSVTH